MSTSGSTSDTSGKKTIYEKLPPLTPSFLTLTKLANNKALAHAFLNDTDERDPHIQGASKPIHAQGVVAPVNYEPTDIGRCLYTGLFHSGGLGLLRLSRAIATDPFTPGLALKLFVDGQPSINLHAMYGLDGQGSDTNFFQNAFTTHVKPPTRVALKVLSFFFRRSFPSISHYSSQTPVDETFLPLNEFASKESGGRVVVDFRAPVVLLFKPNKNLRTDSSSDFRNEISLKVPENTNVYEVFDNHENLIGNITVTERFVASAHGDNMFFQHQRFSGTRCPFA